MRALQWVLPVLLPVLIYFGLQACSSERKEETESSRAEMVERIKQRSEAKRRWNDIGVVYLEDVFKGVGVLDVVAKQRAFLQSEAILICDGIIHSREVDTHTGEMVFEIQVARPSGMHDVRLQVRSTVELTSRGQEGRPFARVNGCFVMMAQLGDTGFHSYIDGRSNLIVRPGSTVQRLFDKGWSPPSEIE